MKLIFFTSTYPFGVGEQWKKNELDEFVHHFDDITVVPFTDGGNANNPKQLPKGVKLVKPLFEREGVVLKPTSIFSILFHPKAPAFIAEFFKKKVYKDKTNIISWLHTTLNIIRLLAHPYIKQVQQQGNDTVLYFFWGKGQSDILPFIDTKRYKKVLVRMHRFDLFEYVNNNYIPYRRQLMQKDEVFIAPCSDNGKQHLLDLYPDAAEHVQTVRLGTKTKGGKASMSTDGVLRILSCSNLSPVKRVHLMIESLQYINVPVLWQHIGDGALAEELKVLVHKLNLEDKFIFKGFMNTDTINDYYTQNTFDLFINTSSSEGVPVSIMEALAAGIPVLATNVGGTAEIVDSSVGDTLPENVTPQELANAIMEYYNLPNDTKQGMRDNAYNRFVNKSNAETLAKELSAILLN